MKRIETLLLLLALHSMVGCGDVECDFGPGVGSPPVSGELRLECSQIRDSVRSSRANSESGTGQWASLGSAQAARAFRFTDIRFRDPHIWVDTGFLCLDATTSLNDALQDRLTMDADDDGLLDAAGLLILDPGGAYGFFQLTSADCTPNNICVPDAPPEVDVAFTYSNDVADPCARPDPATLQPYFPPITLSFRPCFVTSRFTLRLRFADSVFSMQDVRISATYLGDPPIALIHGILEGFLREDEANAVTVPDATPIIGGLILGDILPPGGSNCSRKNDLDFGPDGSTLGWWIYANFEATLVNLETQSVSDVTWSRVKRLFK